MNLAPNDHRPIIGLTVHLESEQYRCRVSYAEAIERAGGVALLLPAIESAIPEYLEICDGLVTTGGDDPVMEVFGVATHPMATPIDARRQAFELELLRQLDSKPHPLLAICLGMQLFALHSGGALDQYLPESLASAEDHWNGSEHAVDGLLGTGLVHSHHRQAITDPGSLEVTAQAPDGVIEGVRDRRHLHRHGVQWHPERTPDQALGQTLFDQLVAACAISQ